MVTSESPSLAGGGQVVSQGTSKDEDARDYFSQMNKHMIPFSTIKEEERELIQLAFSKKKADDRKDWLRNLEVRLQCHFNAHLLRKPYV